MSQSSMHQLGVVAIQPHPPYLPLTWGLGGLPKASTDIPISAVFLALFVTGAITHMTIFQRNRRRGHKFLFSALIFGFCMARIATLSLRIASISKPRNIQLAIAAQIFVVAGVLIVFIINLFFTQRLIRAQHPRIGWHPAFSGFFTGLFVLVGATLVMVITVTVMTFYTLNPNTRRIARDIQLYGATYLAFVATLPIPMVLIGIVFPKRTRVEKFGSGRFRTKIYVLLMASFLLASAAWYRAGTSYKTPVPRNQPMPAYFNKAAFYIFNFGVEIMVVGLYAFLRIDRRFFVPNGAKGQGSYAAGQVKSIDQTGIYTEEETFDDQPQPGEKDTARKGADLESGAERVHG